MAASRTAAIAGGGIGGLATALALARRGWQVSVFESKPGLRETGAGITFSENGLRVLEALGVYDDAMAGANHGTGVELRDGRDHVVDSTPLPEGARLLSTPRRQLLQALEAGCQRAGVRLTTGSEVVDAAATGMLMLADGRRVQADLIVGCDGVWSKTRHALGLKATNEQTDEGALRTIVDAGPEDNALFERGRHIETWNGTRRFLIVPLGRGRIYLALTCLATDHAARSIPVDHASWAASFPQWRHLIERIGAEVSWGVYSIVRARRWSVGHAAILGDAAHAQPPNLGQGGGMAIQNGLALAEALAEIGDGAEDKLRIPAALQAWEAQVRPLTDHCQRWSVLYGELVHLADDVRSRVIRGVMADAWLREQLFMPAMSRPTSTVVSGG